MITRLERARAMPARFGEEVRHDAPAASPASIFL
jgi:hypothetical protein